MELNVKNVNEVKVFEMSGDLNSDTSTDVYQQISGQIQRGDQIVLDMTHVPYMSSAGIRTLLLLYRSILNGGGKIVLVGLSDELKDTLAITGFLEFFNTQATLDAGLKAMK